MGSPSQNDYARKTHLQAPSQLCNDGDSDKSLNRLIFPDTLLTLTTVYNSKVHYACTDITSQE